MRRAGPFTVAHVAYVAVLGVASLAALATLFTTRPALFSAVGTVPAAFAMFLVLGIATRLMSFRVGGIATFSLDTSVYVAAALTLGAGPSTLVVFLAMLLRGGVEWIRREAFEKDHWPPWVSAVKLFFGPSVTALIVLGIGLVFDPRRTFPTFVDRAVETAILAYAATWAGLVFPQFSVVTLSYRLNGVPWRRLGREVLGPALLSELAFIPLGFALAIAYRGRDDTALGAVATSFVIFHYVFRRMWVNSEGMKQKAEELALVEEAGRAAASTLDVAEVARRIGMALLAAVQNCQGVVLTLTGDSPSGASQYVRAADRADKPALLEAVRQSLAGTPGATAPGTAVGQVVSAPLPGPDGGASPGFLSLVYSPGAPASRRDRRLLDSIARPAGIAVENWRLYSLATEDGLTGLFVRRYLQTRLAEEFERARRNATPFCLLMIDVDNLKVVNDRHGHAAGDELLRTVAAAIRESVRGMDVPARLGGDEFAALLPDMTLDEGLVVAERLAGSVRARTFAASQGTVEPSVSVGVAAFPESAPRDAEDLIGKADAALYVVKKSGSKGTVVAARPSPRPEG